MVRGRARSQLGLQPALQDGPALKPCVKISDALFSFVLETFSIFGYRSLELLRRINFRFVHGLVKGASDVPQRASWSSQPGGSRRRHQPQFPVFLCHRRIGAGSPAECAGPIRLLCAGAVRSPSFCERRVSGRRTGRPIAMLRAAVFFRGARALAAIRARLPGVLPGAGAAARPRDRQRHARFDKSNFFGIGCRINLFSVT